MSEKRDEKKTNKNNRRANAAKKDPNTIELNDGTIEKVSCVYKIKRKCLRYKI